MFALLVQIPLPSSLALSAIYIKTAFRALDPMTFRFAIAVTVLLIWKIPNGNVPTFWHKMPLSMSCVKRLTTVKRGTDAARYGVLRRR